MYRRRSDALAKGNAFRAEGKGAQARECYVKAVDVTPAMAYQLIKVRLGAHDEGAQDTQCLTSSCTLLALELTHDRVP